MICICKSNVFIIRYVQCSNIYCYLKMAECKYCHLLYSMGEISSLNNYIDNNKEVSLSNDNENKSSDIRAIEMD